MIKIKRNKKQNKKGALQNLLISACAVVALCAIILVIAIAQRPEKDEQMPYNEFLSAVEEGRVEYVTFIKNEDKLSFKLKDGEEIYKTDDPGTEDFKEKLLLSDVEIKTFEPGTLTVVLTKLPIVLIELFFFGFLGLMVVLLLKMFDILPKKKEQKLRPVSFSDIAGLEEIKEELLFLVNAMKEKKDLPIPKGILLEGPPGNGKTMLARALAAEAGVSFIGLDAGELANKYVGVTGSRLRKLFAEAKECAPCVIFFDELDSLGSKRSNTENDSATREMNGSLNTLLNCLDGIVDGAGIMVIAATNMAERLDNALVRPGRFDKRFYLPRPDRFARMELLKLKSDKLKTGDDVSLERLVVRTDGMSCADVTGVVNEAQLHAAAAGRSAISMDDFDAAILAHCVKGMEKKKTSLSDDDLQIAAYHEAGHVVAALASGKKIVRATLRQTTSGAGGYTMIESDDESQIPTYCGQFDELVELYGGMEAERHLFGDDEKITHGAETDITQATTLASTMVKIRSGVDYGVFGSYGVSRQMEETVSVLDDAKDVAKNILDLRWDEVTVIAQALIEKQTLDGDEIIALLGYDRSFSENSEKF